MGFPLYSTEGFRVYGCRIFAFLSEGVSSGSALGHT